MKDLGTGKEISEGFFYSVRYRYAGDTILTGTGSKVERFLEGFAAFCQQYNYKTTDEYYAWFREYECAYPYVHSEGAD